MSKNITIPVPAVPFAPPVYTCHRAKKDVPVWTEISTNHSGRTPRIPMNFWISRAATCRFRVLSPAQKCSGMTKIFTLLPTLAGDEIWGHLTERDSVIYLDNDFEIFVDPDSDTYHYYEFEMNVLNTVWDLFLAEPYRDGGSGLNGYDMHGLRTAVHVDGSINDPSAENKGWSVEVVIPFSALYEYQKERRAPKNGEFYRMNFSRVQWNVDVKDNTYVKRTDEAGNVLPEDNWVWAPTGVINIHYPELWAFVFFSEDREDAPCDSTIPEDEYRKWELRKLYYAENILFETTGSYSEQPRLNLQETLAAYAPNDCNKTVKALGLHH